MSKENEVLQALDFDLNWNTVNVSAGGVSIKMLSLGELPSMLVLDAAIETNASIRTAMLSRLFMLALPSQEAVEQVSGLPYGQVAQMITQWAMAVDDVET